MIDNKRLKTAIRERYAWPGGYPLYAITSDAAALCVQCCRKEYRLIARERRDYANGNRYHLQWAVLDVQINFENTDLYCDHCNKQIGSAYES